MIANSKVLVKDHNFDVHELSIEELKGHKHIDNMYIFSMLYIKDGIALDFVPLKRINAITDFKHPLFEIVYETPSGLRKTLICDAKTQVMAKGTTNNNPWSGFLSIFNLSQYMYIEDIEGMKCKFCSLRKLDDNETPDVVYHVKTKTNNTFINGILVR